MQILVDSTNQWKHHTLSNNLDSLTQAYAVKYIGSYENAGFTLVKIHVGIDDYNVYGVAACSFKDDFSKIKGLKIAYGRANLAFVLYNKPTICIPYLQRHNDDLETLLDIIEFLD